MKRISLIVLFGLYFAILLVSCENVNPNEEIDEGQVEGKVYTSQDIGWTMQIPGGWEVMTMESMDNMTEKGNEVIEEVFGDIDYSGLKHLISFQKDQFNIFQSTSEPFELEYEGEWEDNNILLREVLYTTYTNQGIQVDTSSSLMTVDGLVFHGFHVTVYAPSGEAILFQDMYGRYINGFDFGVNLNYNNEADKATLMSVWRNSKFKK